MAKSMDKPFAEAQVTGVRSAFKEATNNLTPTKLGQILKDADKGKIVKFLELAHTMLSRDTHYYTVLNIRKRALVAMDINVIGSENTNADELVNMHLLPMIPHVLMSISDAINYGFSVSEINWIPTEGLWLPDVISRDVRHFTTDPLGQRVLLRDDNAVGDNTGTELPENKFIIHQVSPFGTIIDGSLARTCSIVYMSKQIAMADWLTYSELFGQPIRVGKYDASATNKEKETLRRALASLGTDAAAVMPDTMEIEFIETKSKSGKGSSNYEELCRYLDRQMSKAIIGATLLTDEGASHAQASTHSKTTDNIIQADANQAMATINEQLIKPFVDFNIGVLDKYPQINIKLNTDDQLIENSQKLVAMGANVDLVTVANQLGVPLTDTNVDDTIDPVP